MPMATFAQRFGRSVRRIREEKDLSQQAAASLAKIDRAYYWKIEAGVANPSLDVIGRIVKMLGVTSGALFTEVDRER